MKRIRYALALAEEMNFARAAEKLHLSQPALTRSIQTLEAELGLMLFDRDNRNFAVTSIGKVFLERAKRLHHELRGLERDMSLLRDQEIGQVAFGVGPLPAASMLPALVREIRSERPGIRLSVAANNWRYLLLHLRAEEIEFFVADTRDITPTPEIIVTPLCRQFGPFICRAGHPLLFRPDRVVADMLAYGFAAMTMPQAVLPSLRTLFGLPAHAELPITFECDNIHVLSEIVAQDDMIMLSTHASVAQDIDAGILAPLAFPGLPSLFAEIGIVQLNGRTLSPGAELILTKLHHIAAQTYATELHGIQAV